MAHVKGCLKAVLSESFNQSQFEVNRNKRVIITASAWDPFSCVHKKLVCPSSAKMEFH